MPGAGWPTTRPRRLWQDGRRRVCAVASDSPDSARRVRPLVDKHNSRAVRETAPPAPCDARPHDAQMAQFGQYGGQAGGAPQFEQQPWFQMEPQGNMGSNHSSANSLDGMYAPSPGFQGPGAGYGSYDNGQSSFGYDPSLEDEPPLLEELGIDFGDIWSKTKLVLKPSLSEIDPVLVEDADLAGPLVFVFALGGMLMLHGKLHFGYVYGFGMSSCVATYALLNLMTESSAGIEFGAVVSFLGYCLLPVIALAVAALAVSMTSTLGSILSALTVLASTGTSTRLFEAKLHMRHQRYLIAYPLALIYSVFVLITIF